jgi:hypothetical protein
MAQPDPTLARAALASLVSALCTGLVFLVLAVLFAWLAPPEIAAYVNRSLDIPLWALIVIIAVVGAAR